MSVRGIGPGLSQAASLKVDRPATDRSVSSPFPHGIGEVEKVVQRVEKNLVEIKSTIAQLQQDKGNQRLQHAQPKAVDPQTDKEKSVQHQLQNETHKPEINRSQAVLARVVEMLKIILNEVAREHSSVLVVLAQKIKPPSDASSTNTNTGSGDQDEAEEENTGANGTRPVPVRSKQSLLPPILNAVTGYNTKRPFSLPPIEA
jgi:TolA-binding protein